MGGTGNDNYQSMLVMQNAAAADLEEDDAAGQPGQSRDRWQPGRRWATASLLSLCAVATLWMVCGGDSSVVGIQPRTADHAAPAGVLELHASPECNYPTSCACFVKRDANFCGTCATASPPGAGCGTCDNWCQSNVCTVTVYEHADFDGWSVTFDAGKYDHHAMTAMGVKNDHVSSLKVAPGCKATLYEHKHFAGDSGAFTEGSYDHPAMVKIFKNDIASSIKIEPRFSKKTKAACELFAKRDSNFCATCPNCGPCDAWCENQ